MNEWRDRLEEKAQIYIKKYLEFLNTLGKELKLSKFDLVQLHLSLFISSLIYIKKTLAELSLKTLLLTLIQQKIFSKKELKQIFDEILK